MSENNLIRVLVLIEHLRSGGAERLVVDLANAIDPLKIDCIVCTYRESGHLLEDLKNGGHKTIFLRKDLFTGNLPTYLKILKYPLFIAESLLFIFRLAHVIRHQRIQIIHTHMNSANFWGRLAALTVRDVKIVTTFHTLIKNRKLSKQYTINLMLGPFCDRAIGVTQEIAAMIASQHAAKLWKIRVIPNGIPIEGVPLSNFLREQYHPKSPHIGIIGRLVTVKRHDIFLKAVAIVQEKMHDVRAFIVGDGPERLKLEVLTENLQLKNCVYFLGERNDARELMGSFDLVVNTSEREGLPISLIEAMAAGVPIVATDLAGNRTVVQNGTNGILVDVGDVQSLAHAMLSILQNPEMADKMAAAGREKARKEFSIEHVAQMWIELYREVICEKRKHSQTKHTS